MHLQRISLNLCKTNPAVSYGVPALQNCSKKHSKLAGKWEFTKHYNNRLKDFSITSLRFSLFELKILLLQLLIRIPTACRVHNLRANLLDNLLIVLPPVSINPQTEPQAGPWVISGTHKPNQSVISFLYGTEQDDRMSGNTQGVRGSFGGTHASTQKKKWEQ